MNGKNDILESETALHIIKEIELNPQVTQRDLAQKLQISLGKINFIVNALMNKGIIEAKNFKNSKKKLGYMYLLTPHGLKTKMSLIQKFLIWKMKEFENLKEEIKLYKNEAYAYSND